MDNDPLNKQDPSGKRPTDDTTFTPPPPPAPDPPDPDCMTFDDHGRSDSSSESTGQFKADCGAVKKILDRYLPEWRSHKVPIHTSYCGNDGSDSTIGVSGKGVFCASWDALNEAWLRSGSIYHQMTNNLWDAYQHVVIHEYAHVIIHDPNTGLHDQGTDSWVPWYTGNDNANGWPAMDDYDPWSDLLGGDAYSADVHRAVEAQLDGRHNGVDELLADCVAQDAFPSVRGGYWLAFVPESGSGCPDAGKTSAHRFVTGGRR